MRGDGRLLFDGVPSILESCDGVVTVAKVATGVCIRVSGPGVGTGVILTGGVVGFPAGELSLVMLLPAEQSAMKWMFDGNCCGVITASSRLLSVPLPSREYSIEEGLPCKGGRRVIGFAVSSAAAVCGRTFKGVNLGEDLLELPGEFMQNLVDPVDEELVDFGRRN